MLFQGSLPQSLSNFVSSGVELGKLLQVNRFEVKSLMGVDWTSLISFTLSLFNHSNFQSPTTSSSRTRGKKVHLANPCFTDVIFHLQLSFSLPSLLSKSMKQTEERAKCDLRPGSATGVPLSVASLHFFGRMFFPC